MSDESRNVWNETFDESTREAQVEEDSQAWYAVTGLLLTIICIGVTLAVFTVWIVGGTGI